MIDRANAFIGHEQEVDEGYETTMRRNAFIAGFKEALELVRKMREAQKDANDKIGQAESYQEAMYYVSKAEELEKEVDEYLKKMV